MMKKAKLALLASMCLLAPLGANAGGVAPGVYVGGGYLIGNLDDNDFSKDADLDGLFVRGGYQLNDNLAVEGRLGTGINDDRVNGVKVELKEFYGAYFKVGMPTSIGLYPYVIAGGTHGKVEASWHGYHDSDTKTDVSYGVGADYAFANKWSAGLEYMKYLDTDGIDFSGVTLGVNYKF